MDQYCVVLCGLQAGTSDELAAWQPVAAALKLDHAEFERRVLAALPRIVRRGVDQAKAERIARALRAMHVDARVLPDDAQLVYIERAGASCGPLPQSSLDDFIQTGESFRLRGNTTWQPWPMPVEQESAATTTTTVEPEDSDELLSAPALSDEPTDAMSTADTTNDVDDAAPDEPSTDVGGEPPEAASNPPSSAAWDDGGDATQDVVPTGADDEPHDTMLPPLSASPTAQEEPTSVPPDDLEATEPATDAVDSARDEDPIDASGETTTSDSLGASSATTPEAAETVAPTRLRIGRVVVLLILVALAVWAYRHWMADTRMDGSPAAPAVIQPSNPVAGEPVTPAQAAPGHNSVPATAASVSPATSVPAPASTAASPAATTSAPAPAATAAAPPKGSQAAIPAGVTTASATAAETAPATVTNAAATALADSSNRLSTSVDTIAFTQPVRTVPVPAVQRAEAAH